MQIQTKLDTNSRQSTPRHLQASNKRSHSMGTYQPPADPQHMSKHILAKYEHNYGHAHQNESF